MAQCDGTLASAAPARGPGAAEPPAAAECAAARAALSAQREACRNPARCAQCGARIDGTVATLRGPAGTATLHVGCIAAYKHEAAPACRQCAAPIADGAYEMIDGAAYHPGCAVCGQCGAGFAAGEPLLEARVMSSARAPATVLLHCACEEAFDTEHAPRCAHCAGPMRGELAVLTGPAGTANVHPGCVDGFKAASRPAAAPPAEREARPAADAAADPPAREQAEQAEGGEEAVPAAGGEGARPPPGVVLPLLRDSSPPLRTPRGVALLRDAAGRCAHCYEPLDATAGELTLPGAAAAVDLHEACARPYMASRGPQCEHCEGRFGPDDKVLRVQLPKAAAPVLLHEPCVAAYEDAHAAPCAHCGAKIVEGGVTLNGGTDLHAACVDAWKLARAPECCRCAAPILDDHYTVLSNTVDEGACHRACVTCDHCGAGFADGEGLASVQQYSMPGGELRRATALLHERCVDAHRRAAAPGYARDDAAAARGAHGAWESGTVAASRQLLQRRRLTGDGWVASHPAAPTTA